MTTTETPTPAVAEAVTPEVVVPADTHAAGAPLPAVPDGHEAAAALIERAADAALMPGVPGRDEFITLAMTARILCMSGAAPKEVRNNPYLAFHMAMVGRDLGISPSASLELIDVIPGRDGPRLSLSPQLLNGQVERLGLGHIVPGPREADRAVAIAVGHGGHVDGRCRRSWPDHAEGCECHGIIGDSEFTWDDARMAGLVAPLCEPGQHTDPCIRGGSNTVRCNQGYRTYPKRMMWWRAAGFCADDWFPTASMGLYSPEALGAVVDDEGRPIDPSTIDLPEGYQPKAPEPVEVISGEDCDALRKRIGALPEAARSLLQEAWYKGLDGQSEGAYLAPLGGKVGEPPKLPKRQLGKAKALVQHFEDRAKGGEWGDWTPPAAPPETPKPAGDSDGGTAAARPEAEPPAEGSEASEPGADPPSPPAAADTTSPMGGETLEQRAARLGVPLEPQAPQAPEPPAGDPVSCPVCSGTGSLDGEPCWSPECPVGPCTYCGATGEPRRVDGSLVRCVDEDGCWTREQAKDPDAAKLAADADEAIAAAKAAATDVESREVAGDALPANPEFDLDADDPANKPDACPLCHSTRTNLVWVPADHHGNGAMWRCQNATTCKQRREGKAGVEGARAALGTDA